VKTISAVPRKFPLPRRMRILRVIERSLVIVYPVAGWAVMADTGLLPFDSRFWFILGPFFSAVELSLWKLKRIETSA
jgi:hypothetical protein